MIEDLSEAAGSSAPIEAQVFGQEASSRGMLEDVAFDLEISEPSRSPMVCFRLVHMKPASQKSTNSLTDLRSDHVAIRMYEVRDKDWDKHTLTIASTLERDQSAEAVKLLSLKAFSTLGFDKIASSFVRCDCAAEVTYFFQGVSMSPLCH